MAHRSEDLAESDASETGRWVGDMEQGGPSAVELISA